MQEKKVVLSGLSGIERLQLILGELNLQGNLLTTLVKYAELDRRKHTCIGSIFALKHN